MPGTETENFVGYWTAKSGRDATKLDWDLTWQGWIRREAKRIYDRQRGSNVRSMPNRQPSTNPTEHAATVAAFGG